MSVLIPLCRCYGNFLTEAIYVSRFYNTQWTQSSNVEVAHVLGLIMKLEEKTLKTVIIIIIKCFI